MTTESQDQRNVTLVTGVGGFIGFHVARQLGRIGRVIVGIDVMNTYYDVALKDARLKVLRGHVPSLECQRIDLADRAAVQELFERHKPAKLIHLAAQAGDHYS